MSEFLYGSRKYVTSDKSKRPQKNELDSDQIAKRNSRQKKLYITLDNIDEMFSKNDDKFLISYDFLFNLIQGKVTKYFKTRNYDRKKELSYDCMNRLYSVLKRKLLRLKDAQGLLNPPPVIFFYLSQFFRYVDLVVYSTIFHGAQDQKYLVQEPEEFNTEDILNEQLDQVVFVEEIEDRSDLVKKFIEESEIFSSKEKKLLYKIYKNSYTKYGGLLTKKEEECLLELRNKLIDNPELLKELEEICNVQ